MVTPGLLDSAARHQDAAETFTSDVRKAPIIHRVFNQPYDWLKYDGNMILSHPPSPRLVAIMASRLGPDGREIVELVVSGQATVVELVVSA